MEINEVARTQIESIKEKCKIIKPLVVIWCLTYNHGKYLKDALEGFIMQKTTFPFVVIVHEDVSTDGTAKVLKEYAERYPSIILPIFESENQFSKSDGSLKIIMNNACKETGAKYVAWCEGDDYWINPFKLQKQVDFLETHPDISYTCHRYKIQINDSNQLILAPNAYLDEYTSEEGFEFDFQYVFKNDWVTKTLTSLYRIELLDLKELIDCYFYRDIHIIYEILSKTNGYCFQFIGGVYRKQETGVWSQLDLLTKGYIEVKTWESIYDRHPTKFNRRKYRSNYAYYVYLAIKNRKFFKIRKPKELKALFFIPIELYKLAKLTNQKKELFRIAQLSLNKIRLDEN